MLYVYLLYVSSTNEEKLKAFDPIESLCSCGAKISVLAHSTQLFLLEKKTYIFTVICYMFRLLYQRCHECSTTLRRVKKTPYTASLQLQCGSKISHTTIIIIIIIIIMFMKG